MAHTPTPWTRSGNLIGTNAGIICSMFVHDARGRHDGKGLTAEEQEANTALFMGAPAMLAELKEMLTELIAYCGEEANDDTLNGEAIRRLARVIRLAEPGWAPGEITKPSAAQKLAAALQQLLDCPETNFDDIDEITREAIDNAETVLGETRVAWDSGAK